MTPEQQIKVYIELNYRSNYQAAKALGVSVSTIQRIMAGLSVSLPTLNHFKERGVPFVMDELELTAESYMARLDKHVYQIANKLKVIKSASPKKYERRIKTINRLLNLPNLFNNGNEDETTSTSEQESETTLTND